MLDRFRLLAADRGVVAIAGPDRVAFLQGLVSNDVAKVGAARAVYAAFLTPQGKFLHDFFLAERDDALLLDCEAARRDDLIQRLRRFRLRSKVELSDATDGIAVGLLVGADAAEAAGLPAEAGRAGPLGDGVAFVDPRLPALGVRALLPRDAAEQALAATGFPPGEAADYDRLRLSLGVPDGSRDVVVDKGFLLESGFDELNGISWDKGCYMGQELTARTKYRGLVRRRLVPVTIEGAVPEPGAPVLLDGKDVGEMRSAQDGAGLALLRLEAIDAASQSGAPLTAGESRLTPRLPDWMRTAKAAS